MHALVNLLLVAVRLAVFLRPTFLTMITHDMSTLNGWSRLAVFHCNLLTDFLVLSCTFVLWNLSAVDLLVHVVADWIVLVFADMFVHNVAVIDIDDLAFVFVESITLLLGVIDAFFLVHLVAFVLVVVLAFLLGNWLADVLGNLLALLDVLN